MSKLSKENIKFIDNYLVNSGIEFIDVRFEMLDHVASEIEMQIKNGDTRSFYFIFKDYMAQNKSMLLKYNNKYHWVLDRKILNGILKKSLSFKGVVIFLTVFLSLNFLNEILSQGLFIQIMWALPFVIFLLFAGMYRFVGKNKKYRFSSIDRIAIYFMVLGQILNLQLQGMLFGKTVILEQPFQSIIITSFFIFLLVILMQIVFQFKKDCQLKYKSIL